MKRMSLMADSGKAKYVSMFGMPVLWKAVDTSPQGMVLAVTGPRHRQHHSLG